MSTLLEVRNLTIAFPRTSRSWRRDDMVEIVTDVSFSLNDGEVLGIVGESGCGKTTTARAIVGLNKAKAGQILLRGEDIARRKRKKTELAEIQMVFQDPFGSLNPRMKIKAIIAAGWRVHRSLFRPSEFGDEIQRLLSVVGLPREASERFPHQFSGGQRQRIGIARAMALKPSLIVCDEPVSALDVSIQAQVLNLLKNLQKTLGMAMIFIAHDLSVVRYVSDRVAVMYMGKIVEIGAAKEIFESPSHPYSQALLSAVPDVDSESEWSPAPIPGDLPSLTDPPSGCRFRTRCWRAEAICAQTEPPLAPAMTGIGDHEIACHFAEEVSAQWRQGEVRGTSRRATGRT